MALQAIRFVQIFTILTTTVVEGVNLSNIEVRKSISLSQLSRRVRDGPDCGLAVFGETLATVVHDAVKVVRNLQRVDLAMIVLVEVISFIC